MRTNKTSVSISKLPYPLKKCPLFGRKHLSVAQTGYFEISSEIQLQSYQFEFVGYWTL